MCRGQWSICLLIRRLFGGEEKDWEGGGGRDV